jgi:hypothetical protein
MALMWVPRMFTRGCIEKKLRRKKGGNPEWSGGKSALWNWHVFYPTKELIDIPELFLKKMEIDQQTVEKRRDNSAKNR